jgi:hypothetical protein
MAKNDLHKRLQGKFPLPSRRAGRSLLLRSWQAALLVALLAAFWVAIVDDPDGGRSVAMADIAEAAPVSTGSIAGGGADDGPTTPPETTVLPGHRTLKSIWRPCRIAPPAPGGDAGLLEPSQFGPLPRVSPDGRRPRDAYARRAPAATPGLPRVVLVVNGMGLSQTGTQSAIEALPEDVTLAFAPYGSSLQRWIDKARAQGHEVLLQIPLEPDGYPDQNPGEHTLLVSTDRHANEQDLHWILARATGYAGVMNHMGARFTSDDRALLPFPGSSGRARAVLPRRRIFPAQHGAPRRGDPAGSRAHWRPYSRPTALARRHRGGTRRIGVACPQERPGDWNRLGLSGVG